MGLETIDLETKIQKEDSKTKDELSPADSPNILSNLSDCKLSESALETLDSIQQKKENESLLTTEPSLFPALPSVDPINSEKKGDESFDDALCDSGSHIVSSESTNPSITSNCEDNKLCNDGIKLEQASIETSHDKFSERNDSCTDIKDEFEDTSEPSKLSISTEMSEEIDINNDRYTGISSEYGSEYDSDMSGDDEAINLNATKKMFLRKVLNRELTFEDGALFDEPLRLFDMNESDLKEQMEDLKKKLELDAENYEYPKFESAAEENEYVKSLMDEYQDNDSCNESCNCDECKTASDDDKPDYECEGSEWSFEVSKSFSYIPSTSKSNKTLSESTLDQQMEVDEEEKPVDLESILTEPKCGLCSADGKFWSLPCKHSFHKTCITYSFEKERNCPVCRTEF